MTKRLRVSLIASVGAVLCASAMMLSLRASQASQSRPTATTIWTGVYTTTQAARGRRVYMQACSRCHRDDLRGSEKGLPLTGSSFFDHWHDMALPGLMLHIRTAMPHDHVVFISAVDARDIVAFLLEGNGAPAGHDELPTDLATLGQILITNPPLK